MHSKDTGQISVRPALTATPCQQLPHANSDPKPTAIPRRQRSHAGSHHSDTANPHRQRPIGNSNPTERPFPRRQQSHANSDHSPWFTIFSCFQQSSTLYVLSTPSSPPYGPSMTWNKLLFNLSLQPTIQVPKNLSVVHIIFLFVELLLSVLKFTLVVLQSSRVKLMGFSFPSNIYTQL